MLIDILARPGIVRAVVDVPLIVAAFAAVVDRILDILQASDVEVINLVVQPAHHLRDALVQHRGLGVGLQPCDAGDSDVIVDVLCDGKLGAREYRSDRRRPRMRPARLR
jgi:hypothetical protein